MKRKIVELIENKKGRYMAEELAEEILHGIRKAAYQLREDGITLHEWDGIRLLLEELEDE